MTKDTVLLTGVTGFVATHIFELLLNRGYYVIGTYRNKDKLDFIRDRYISKKDQFKFSHVEDIRADGAFDEVFRDNKEIKYVIHTASPFFIPTSEPEKTILLPAIRGTTNILEAIRDHAPQVKHVVITSSFAAQMQQSYLSDPSFTYSEKTWNPVTYEQSKDLKMTYIGSKKLAEKVLWDFIDQNKVNFQATAINPVYIFGPLLQAMSSPKEMNTSNSVIYSLYKSKPGDTIKNSVDLEVDVRDVALAHVLAIEKIPESNGKRWFSVNGFFDRYLILDTIKKHFPELKLAEVPSDWKLDPSKYSTIDNNATKKESGIKHIDFEKTIVDTIHSFIEYEKKYWEKL